MLMSLALRLHRFPFSPKSPPSSSSTATATPAPRPRPLRALHSSPHTPSRSFRAPANNSRPRDRDPPPPSLDRPLPPHVAITAPLTDFTTRSHTCAALRTDDVGSTVTLAGWLVSERKGNSNFSFFLIRDAYGATQLTVNRTAPAFDIFDQRTRRDDEPISVLSSAPPHSVVLVEGIVRARPPVAARENDPTGGIEVNVRKALLLNPATQLPFNPLATNQTTSEHVRALNRHLDLRRPQLVSNLRKRSHVTHLVRNILHNGDFVEVETPILLKSSPEGAREFLVPTRLSTSSTTDGAPHSLLPQPLFYALSQSPQQPKQLLVCSGGVDKYFQFARCFRDEDGRKDRQPEFTQLDLEMAFVSHLPSPADLAALEGQQWRIGGGIVRDTVEGLVKSIWEKFEGVKLEDRFRVMTYQDAMARFGSDKPDLRFGLEIKDVTALLPDPIRSSLRDRDEIVECLVLPAVHSSWRNKLALPESQSLDAIKVNETNHLLWPNRASSLRNILGSESVEMNPEQTAALNKHLGVTPSSTVYLTTRKHVAEGASTVLGRVRLVIRDLLLLSQQRSEPATPQSTKSKKGKDGKKAPPATTRAPDHPEMTISKQPHFLWVTEFPLFTKVDEDKNELSSLWGDNERPGESDAQADGTSMSKATPRWSSSHHPFTAPMVEDIEKMKAGDFHSVRGQHFDLVLNGIEIGGGSVRIHDAQMQEYVFDKVLQLTDDEKSAFSHLLRALRAGAPPHGGIALGFDRLMSILCKTESIRDVIAFPKTGGGTDPFFHSPSPLDRVRANPTLRQYGLRTTSDPLQGR